MDSDPGRSGAAPVRNTYSLEMFSPTVVTQLARVMLLAAPADQELSVTAPDRLRSGLITPLFTAEEKLCNACKVIQHGKIHLYILYILATLVALLVWGLHS